MNWQNFNQFLQTNLLVAPDANDFKPEYAYLLKNLNQQEKLNWDYDWHIFLQSLRDDSNLNNGHPYHYLPAFGLDNDTIPTFNELFPPERRDYLFFGDIDDELQLEPTSYSVLEKIYNLWKQDRELSENLKKQKQEISDSIGQATDKFAKSLVAQFLKKEGLLAKSNKWLQDYQKLSPPEQERLKIEQEYFTNEVKEMEEILAEMTSEQQEAKEKNWWDNNQKYVWWGLVIIVIVLGINWLTSQLKKLA
jgi:hypothetical protein